MEKYRLRKPFEFCGQAYRDLEFDFEALTGDAMTSASAEIAAASPGRMVVVLEFDTAYLLAIARLAGQLPPGLLGALPLRDATEIRQLAWRFFHGRGSSDEEDEEDSEKYE